MPVPGIFLTPGTCADASQQSGRLVATLSVARPSRAETSLLNGGPGSPVTSATAVRSAANGLRLTLAGRYCCNNR